jgi:Short C-terminal domain
MPDKVLLKINGSLLFSNTWKQELVITESGVLGEVLRTGQRVKMSLPFDRIAQVNIIRGVFKADIELVNKGGADNLIISAVRKEDAEKAKSLIESMIKKTTTTSSASIADELRKLADLKEQGILTDSEFQTQKRKLLG